ncbi:uncharacterized protein LOC133841981 [Drosophila sulfurigaster albostrigata]|uniref:uncharacterized protein LOC133841981 n=1 Tax=Drosophila sulfurigaster albostrigata TaxID=89887 RepID=UPI002D21DBF1|nr:uncharacterized protein LOC133841981 [Drosophila sulfurigaster albostrigata]
MTRSVYDVQRDFALSSGLRSEIIWDALSVDQADVLQQKIANLIGVHEAKITRKVARQRQQVFDNVWQQRKYTNDVLLSAIIYVLVTNETDPELAMQSTSFTCHPVIRTRKCVMEEEEDNSDCCCMIFIDEHGRVYANWRQYVYNNTLPKGTMIAPSQGIYRLTNDVDTGVHLMMHATPASRVKCKVLKASDTVATMGGLAASLPVAAALAMPVAPPLLLGATVVGVTAAAYSTVRSASGLFDRHRYGQSNSLCDNEARNSWLGVAGGVVGLGATGAANALSVVGSEAHAAAQLAVKGINVTSIVISGTGVANSAYDLYLKISDDEPLSGIDLLQLASSLIIFTHSINNLRLANEATNASDLRYAVRNQTSKIFGQIANESAMLQSRDAATQKFDFVRTLNDIPYKEVLLSALGAYKNLSDLGAALLPHLISSNEAGETQLNVEFLAKQFGPKFVQHISNWNNLLDVLLALGRYFSEQTVQLLMQLTRTFLEQNVDGIECTLKTFLSTEAVLYRILMECLRNYKDFTLELLDQSREPILAGVATYFESLQPNNTENCRRIKCKDCPGFYHLKEK